MRVRRLSKTYTNLNPVVYCVFAMGEVRYADSGNMISQSQTSRVNESEVIEQLRERLGNAVRSHLVSDVPVGALLSGGVDSSAVVGLMAQHLGSSFKTFSIGFGEQEFDELPHAQRVAERWQTQHYTEIVRPSDAIGILDELTTHLDEPFADASAIPTWYVAKLAAHTRQGSPFWGWRR